MPPDKTVRPKTLHLCLGMPYIVEVVEVGVIQRASSIEAEEPEISPTREEEFANDEEVDGNQHCESGCSSGLDLCRSRDRQSIRGSGPNS